MSLDLNKVVQQIEGMAARMVAGAGEKKQRCERAEAVLHDQAGNIELLTEKLRQSKTSWLMAGPGSGLDRTYTAPPPPPGFTVIASDGSHVDIDRHRQAPCYLINIGSVTLRYGENPAAFLDNIPQLYYGDEATLIFPPPGSSGREQPIEGPLLGIKRSVAECRRLAELASDLSDGSPAVAMMDGSLILWGLVSKDCPEFITRALLENGFLAHLEEMRVLAASRDLALASYISFPRSTDVIGALRVALCPHEVANCDRYCDGISHRGRPCAEIAGIQDRELFNRVLNLGERSEIFLSTSSIVSKHYGRHRVYFFYLKLADEIARVEIPEWVAQDERRLRLVHSLVLDQCRLGQGYPVALSEAHQQAVINSADRENFWQLVESCMEAEKLPTLDSAKSRSKRTKWI